MKLEEYTRRKFLKKALSIAGLTLLAGLTKCTSHRVYEFIGEVDGEQIKFKSSIYTPTTFQNILDVTKKDGTKIRYLDTSDDLKLEKVIINGEEYTYNEVGEPVLEKAQKQFDCYLEKILKEKRIIIKEKQKKGLEALGDGLK